MDIEEKYSLLSKSVKEVQYIIEELDNSYNTIIRLEKRIEDNNYKNKQLERDNKSLSDKLVNYGMYKKVFNELKK